MTNGTVPELSHHQALAALCLCISATYLQLVSSVKLVADLCQLLLISAHFANECTLCCCAPLAIQTSILNASHQWQLALAADAAKKDPEQFKIWREDPPQFSFDGRYPLLEVYDKAKEAWKGRTCACSACLPICLSACLCITEPSLGMRESLCFHWPGILSFDACVCGPAGLNSACALVRPAGFCLCLPARPSFPCTVHVSV